MSFAEAGMLHVAAGVLIDTQGRVLLAERPAGKHLAGLWEFPGGKLEPGEAAREALVRELNEELGIAVTKCRPLLQLPWRYGSRALLLDCWLVTAWRGEPASQEGQGLRWLLPGEVDPLTLTPADAVLLQRVIERG